MDHVTVTCEPRTRPRPLPDVAMRRLLAIPEGVSPAGRPPAHRVMGASLLVSAARCLLSYVVLPLLAPLVGLVTVNPVLGLVLGSIALAANVVAVRRFWLADHPWRWPYTALSAIVVAMIMVLLARDVIDVFR
jgi:hypothetical protein